MNTYTTPEPPMFNAGCADCRLRFTRAEAAHLGNCPGCAQPIGQFANLDQLIGFRLHTQEPLNPPQGTAVEISLPVPDLRRDRP